MAVPLHAPCKDYELEARIVDAVERGNQPIWKGREALALSEVLPSPLPARAPEPQKSWWPCDFCRRSHRVERTHRGGREKAFCTSLRMKVYSPEALQHWCAHDAKGVEVDA